MTESVLHSQNIVVTVLLDARVASSDGRTCIVAMLTACDDHFRWGALK